MGAWCSVGSQLGIPAWGCHVLSLSSFPPPCPTPGFLSCQLLQDLGFLSFGTYVFFWNNIKYCLAIQANTAPFVHVLIFLLLSKDPQWSLPDPKPCVRCPALNKTGTDTISYFLLIQNRGRKPDASGMCISFGMSCSKTILILTNKLYLSVLYAHIFSFIGKI